MKRASLAADGTLLFYCPGCEEPHGVPVRAANATMNWSWNSSEENPTLAPSIRLRWAPGGRCCHCFLQDGTILFLADCTHALAGKRMPLPAWADWGRA